MRQGRTIFLAPIVALALLVGMAAETAGTRSVPPDAEPYHVAAKAAVDSIPTRIGSWSARPESIPREAIALLKPNVIRCLKYVDNDATQPRSELRWASLLIDQCRDARDMSGHWPPNCYVNSGQEMTLTQPFDLTVDGLTIRGTEYHFRQTTSTSSTRTAVYDFLIVPKRGIYPDMNGLRRASENYVQRFYGAAQVQLVMDADLPQSDRDAIFETLMKPCVPVIRTLAMQ
jgi:hypothetical protein